MVKTGLILLYDLDCFKVFQSLTCSEFGRDLIFVIAIRPIILRSLIIAQLRHQRQRSLLMLSLILFKQLTVVDFSIDFLLPRF